MKRKFVLSIGILFIVLVSGMYCTRRIYGQLDEQNVEIKVVQGDAKELNNLIIRLGTATSTYQDAFDHRDIITEYGDYEIRFDQGKASTKTNLSIVENLNDKEGENRYRAGYINTYFSIEGKETGAYDITDIYSSGGRHYYSNSFDSYLSVTIRKDMKGLSDLLYDLGRVEIEDRREAYYETEVGKNYQKKIDYAPTLYGKAEVFAEDDDYYYIYVYADEIRYRYTESVSYNGAYDDSAIVQNVKETQKAQETMDGEKVNYRMTAGIYAAKKNLKYNGASFNQKGDGQWILPLEIDSSRNLSILCGNYVKETETFFMLTLENNTELWCYGTQKNTEKIYKSNIGTIQGSEESRKINVICGTNGSIITYLLSERNGNRLITVDTSKPEDMKVLQDTLAWKDMKTLHEITISDKMAKSFIGDISTEEIAGISYRDGKTIVIIVQMESIENPESNDSDWLIRGSSKLHMYIFDQENENCIYEGYLTIPNTCGAETITSLTIE